MANKELTRRQQVFVAQYLIGLNATRAAIAAGYSEATAAEQASRMLKNVKVAESIRRKLGKTLDDLDITMERTLRELAALAYFDPMNLFNSDGSPKQMNEIDEVSRRALAGIKIQELFEGQGDQKHVYGLSKEYRNLGKGANLEWLAKFQGWITQKVERTGKFKLERLICGEIS